MTFQKIIEWSRRPTVTLPEPDERAHAGFKEGRDIPEACAPGQAGTDDVVINPSVAGPVNLARRIEIDQLHRNHLSPSTNVTAPQIARIIRLKPCDPIDAPSRSVARSPSMSGVSGSALMIG